MHPNTSAQASVGRGLFNGATHMTSSHTPIDIQDLERQVAETAKPFQQLVSEMQRVVVGQHELLEGV
jgi:hypothetical protein